MLKAKELHAFYVEELLRLESDAKKGLQKTQVKINRVYSTVQARQSIISTIRRVLITFLVKLQRRVEDAADKAARKHAEQEIVQLGALKEIREYLRAL